MSHVAAEQLPTVGVVGLGYWGPNLLRVLIERLDVKVRWICDLEHERLGRFARRYPSARITQDLDDLLNDSELDGILLATPVDTHYCLARRTSTSERSTSTRSRFGPQ